MKDETCSGIQVAWSAHGHIMCVRIETVNPDVPITEFSYHSIDFYFLLCIISILH